MTNITGSAGTEWALIHSSRFTGIVRLTGGFPQAVGFVGSTPPTPTTPGFSINRIGDELDIPAGESFYLRSYRGTVDVMLVRGEGGGAGFVLGPIDNLFGATSGDASSTILSVSPAATRAAAEGVRDAYFTANPSNLVTYDAEGNESLGIYIYFLDGGDTEIIGQTRVSNVWVDNISVQAIRGLPGSGTDFSNVSENHIPAIGAAPDRLPYDSGLIVDATNNRFTTEMSMQIGSASLEFDEGGLVSGGVRRSLKPR